MCNSCLAGEATLQFVENLGYQRGRVFTESAYNLLFVDDSTPDRAEVKDLAEDLESEQRKFFPFTHYSALIDKAKDSEALWKVFKKELKEGVESMMEELEIGWAG